MEVAVAVDVILAANLSVVNLVVASLVAASQNVSLAVNADDAALRSLVVLLVDVEAAKLF